MNQRSTVLPSLVALAGITAGLFYTIRSARRRNALLCQIRNTVERSDARSHVTHRLLKKQRRALDAITEYLLPVPKGVEKPAS